MEPGVFVTSKKGRAGMVLPFEVLTKLSTFGVTIVIMVLALLIWPMFIFWHQASYIIVALAIIVGIRRRKKGRS